MKNSGLALTAIVALLTSCNSDDKPARLSQNSCSSLAGSKATTLSALARQNENTLADLNRELLDRSDDFRSADESRKPGLAENLRALSRRRMELLKLQIRQSPASAMSLMLSDHLAGGLPEAARVCMERRFSRSGTIKVYGTLESDGSGRIQYRLETAEGTRHSLHFSEGAPALRSGATVNVEGIQTGCEPNALLAETPPVTKSPDGNPGLSFADPVVVGGSGVSAGYASPPSAPITGPQSTLAILVSFQDQANSDSVATANDLVFNQLNQFWNESSFHNVSVTGQVAGPYTLPMSIQSCDVDQMSSLARQAAVNAGINTSQYSHFIYVFPKDAACGGWLGLGTVGGNPSEAWINGSLQFHTVAHEMGHNIGLYHANALDCGTVSMGTSCSNVEYADPTSVMGNRVAGQYTAYQKEQLGWLGTSNSPPITLVQADGVINLEPYETATGNPKALKILKSVNPATGERVYYYIEYRQPIGFDRVFDDVFYDHNLTSGVVVHTGSDQNADSSYIVDMNPALNSWYQSALNVGQTYQDPYSGMTLSLLSADASGARVDVKVGNGNAGLQTCVRK